MFKKIIFLIFLLLPIRAFSLSQELQEPEKPIIIPRASWGANELYTSIDSEYWKQIIENRGNTPTVYISPEKQKKQAEDYKRTIDYINENFAPENTIVEKIDYNPRDNFKLAWALSYTQEVQAIVIHHTKSEYKSSLEGIQDIYRYHALNRQWWDIGYNYVIGYDGEIFEWKKWGDYISAAHSKWNNNSTVGISIMGDYTDKEISKQQYESLEKLVRYLAWKYGIDFSKKHYYHMKCAGEKCNTFPLETYLDSTLVGHRDTGHTSCPGDKLYAQIDQLREDNLAFTAGFIPIKREEAIIQKKEETQAKSPKIQHLLQVLKPYSKQELQTIKGKINELLLDESMSHERRKKLQILRLAVTLSYDN